jgi:hydroxymethylpyrimidine pyrophosphatase-like HAD family hydrolase
MAGLPVTRAYHLIPAGASKTRAVARHMQARGYASRDCIAVGDSREDMEVASAVGTFWLVANARERDPELARDLAFPSRTRLASGTYGAGVYEAVVTTLAEERA